MIRCCKIIFLSIITTAVFFSCNRKELLKKEPAVILPNGYVVKIRIARTESEQEMGLMLEENLLEDEGMLFVYREPVIPAFWMKNCKISLDLLWILSDGTIADISESVPPCYEDPCPTYSPPVPISYVLEVNGGFARRHNLKQRDVIKIYE